MLVFDMKYLNSKEISDILGVNISTLKRWTDNGTIDCHKTAGGHREFTMQNVRDYYRKNKKASKSDAINLKNIDHKKISKRAKIYQQLMNAQPTKAQLAAMKRKRKKK